MHSRLALGVLALLGWLRLPCRAGEPELLLDKTLVVWAAPADLEQRGGSALTIDAGGPDRFDAIVFGELEPAVWMAGSNGFQRTWRQQSSWPKESAGPAELVQIAIVYQGREVRLYRDGEPYAAYRMGIEPQGFGPGSIVMIGPRHAHDTRDRFLGRIRDARVYPLALERETIAAMRPGRAVPDLEPWAWWDFAQSGTWERTGRFNVVRLEGAARIEGDALVLDGERSGLIAFTERGEQDALAATPGTWSKDDPVPPAVLRSTRLLREQLLADPFRPRYHFALPEDDGRPGDPNGCFYAAGRYHLMYLYNRSGVGFSWGHVSSHDLVHWRHHPDAIGPGAGDEGCFSGGAFLDEDGTAYLSYWMLWGAKGIGLARSSAADYSRWEKLAANPVLRSTEWGITRTLGSRGEPLVLGSADPSNIWKKGGKYYFLTGNLLVLEKYGRAPDAPGEMRGDHLDLFESEDLVEWRPRGRFYERRPEWTDDSEDSMCPSFLPLPASPEGGAPSGKHLLSFISHNRGCQYYVGDYDEETDRFLPTAHGRMTWVDNTYFAPEALVDGHGRQILWAWLTDDPAGVEARGWSGVYGLPRALWLGEDGTLRMRPVPELEALRTNPRDWSGLRLADGESRLLEGLAGDACELQLELMPATSATRVGLRVRASPAGEEETLLYYDARERALCFDARRSGADGRRVLERAPLLLATDEPLRLRVFVDASVIEVFANDRQAITRRVYPARTDSLGVGVFASGGELRCERLLGWSMAPANPY